ncbi:MAG: alpha/beta fold hydrolase [Bdellovibrionales bacterium]|nr:alpha/beta fold hydrolase [Bdellovibrionales bacterium]
MGIEDRVERVLKKLKLNKFYPFPFARSGYLQTVYGSYWPILKPSKPDCFHHVMLPDGDILVMAENRPIGWKSGSRIMLLVHGVTGSHQSTYMQRMCRRLHRKGYMVLRLNLRHCGPGKGLARHPYHGGVSSDTRVVLEWIKQKYPDSPVTQIGFSLGGNITLKMAGEDGSRPSGNLDSLVAVSPPVDLEASSLRMGLRENRLFENVFVRSLMADTKEILQRLPPEERFDLPKEHTIRAFEELFATHRAGFANAKEYYEKCSSINYIPEIKLPTLILSSVDDPVVDGRALARISHSDNVDIILTSHGGHVGFLGWGTTYDEVRWSDQVVARWLEDTMAI